VSHLICVHVECADTTFDVLPLLRPRHNAVGAMLGNYKWGYIGVWCDMSKAGGPDGCRAFVLQLSVTLDDGTELLHTTNSNHSTQVAAGGGAAADGQGRSLGQAQSAWQCRQGPVLWDHLYHGETYDARNEVAGWSSLPFEQLLATAQRQSTQQGQYSLVHPWQPCVEMSPPGSSSAAGGSESKPTFGPLVPMSIPPIRALETFPAVSVHVGLPAPPSGAPANCWKQEVLVAVADECLPPTGGGPPLCTNDCVMLEVPGAKTPRRFL
jgi:hypothetical protein